MPSPIIKPHSTHQPWRKPQRTFFYAVTRSQYAEAGCVLAAWWKRAPPTEALNTMARLLEPGSEPDFRPRYAKGTHANGTHAFHLHRELTRLKRAGVTPWSALLTLCAVFCHVWSDPRRTGDGIGLTYALAAEVFKLAKLRPKGRHWDGKRGTMVNTGSYLPRSVWRSWGSRARTELVRFLVECHQYVSEHPQRRIIPQNRKLDTSPEQARLRADRRVRKAFDRALNLAPTVSGRNKNNDTIATMNRVRREQQMTEMARREQYVAPPGTSDVPAAWDYSGEAAERPGDGDEAPQQQPTAPQIMPDGMRVQGAKLATRPNFTGINPAIKAQLDEQAKAQQTTEGEYEPTHQEMVTVAQELKADLNYPLGRAKVIGTIRERRR